MLRRLFTLLSAVSLVLCVATCVLWVRSYVSTFVLAEVGSPPRFLLMAARGQAIWQVSPARPGPGDATAVEGWHGLGFASYREHHGPASRYSLTVPFWFLALALAVPPATRLPGLLRLLASRQGRRSAAGWVRGRGAAARRAVGGRHQPAGERSDRPARRLPSPACAASAVLVLGGAAMLWVGGRPARDRDRNVLPPPGPPPPPGVNPDAVAPKVLLYVFDPVMENLGGVRQHAAYGWQDPVALAARVAATLAADSHGLVDYRVVRTVVADAHPYFADGFRHTDASFAAAWAARDFHPTSTFDYPRFVRENDLAARADAGEVDEVWVYAGPIAGMYESVMAGRGAYWINGPAQPGGRRVFPIMGWNFERGLAEALHSYGHRAEGTLDHLYGTQRPNRDNNWNRFTFQDRYGAGRGGVGNVHFPANGTRDYDYANPTPVLSDADDWYNYPHLTGARKPVSAATWDPAGTDAHLGYMNWWYHHLPHMPGRGTDGRLANWWRYLADLDQFKGTNGDLRGTAGTAEVRVSAPARGAGVVRVRAEARADGAVGRVNFYVDGVYRATDALAPYTFDWDTSGVGGGRHAVVAKAYELQNGTEAVSAAAVVWLTSLQPAAPTTAPAAGAAE